MAMTRIRLLAVAALFLALSAGGLSAQDVLRLGDAPRAGGSGVGITSSPGYRASQPQARVRVAIPSGGGGTTQTYPEYSGYGGYPPQPAGETPEPPPIATAPGQPRSMTYEEYLASQSPQTTPSASPPQPAQPEQPAPPEPAPVTYREPTPASPTPPSSGYYSSPQTTEPPTPPEPRVVERVVVREPEPKVLAVVNGQDITDQDVLREMWDRRGRETLEWLIGRRILERELSRLGLSVADDEVNERMRRHLEGLRKAFPNLQRPEDLTRAASGMLVDEYRDRSVWSELALRKIMRAVVKPTEEQLRGYYAERQAEFIKPERVRVSQVFIAPQSDPDGLEGPGRDDWTLAERQILEAHGRLRMGEDFAAVARAYGAGGQTARWVQRGELLRELEEAAFSIRPGSITKPLKSGLGYHVIRVEEKQERSQPRFEEVREVVREQYEEKLFVLMAGEFMTRLREKARKDGNLVVGEAPDLFQAK